MNTTLHPALWQLVQMRTLGRIRALVASMRKPRKLFVSILGAVLAAVWLSNVIASILFRDRYEPETLRVWMTLGLTLYAGWHLIRVSWQRPDTAIEWTPAEFGTLLTSPFRRQELILYRLTTIFGVTTFKAGLGTLLLLPDIPVPWLGFLAMWFGLAFVELIRLIADNLTVGMSDVAYRLFRVTVVVLLGSFGLYCGAQALHAASQLSPDAEIPIVVEVGRNFFLTILSGLQTPLGELLSAPFALFVSVMLSPSLTGEVALMTLAGFSVLFVTAWILTRIDRWSQAEILKRDKAAVFCPEATRPVEQWHDTRTRSRRFWIRVCGGAVEWRQWVGVTRYGTGVVMCLIPPAILSALPLFMPHLSDRMAILNFLGGLIFYSFLLLPSAMKFDFRRDYSHLLLLKLLPLPAWRVVLGQIATPIVITTAFQFLMIAAACAIRGMSPGVLLASLLSFPAMNFAVYGWENLMFLIFPQQLKQEGLEVFLRTTVLFTAKGLTCLLIFAILFCWALVAASMARAVGPFLPLLGDHRVVFGLGVWLSVTGLGIVMTLLAARQFHSLEAWPDTQTA